MAVEVTAEVELTPPSSVSTDGPWTRYSPVRRWVMLAVLLLIAASNYLVAFSMSVLLEPLKIDFHVSDTQLGLLSGICFSLFYAVAAVPFARWADYGNRRTAIVVALTAWSTMTALCGAARSFWQLAIMRFGVGAAASGCLPAAQSLVADYFPPRQRGTAVGLINAALNVGMFFGVALAGLVAAAAGWRVAFLWLGLPGLVLAVIAWLTLAEPRVEANSSAGAVAVESLAESVSRLRHKPSFVYTLIAFSVYCMFAYGSSTFIPSFMMRTLHATLSQAGATWGVVILVANVIGSVVGGWLGDRLSRRSLSWYGWIPAITCVLGAVLYWLAFSTTSFWSFISVEFCAECTLGIGFPPIYAGVHVICGSRRRGLAMGILFLSMMLCGNSIGPLVVGALSDWLSGTQAEEGLRHALLMSCFIVLPAAAAYWAAARAIPRDLED